MNNLFTHIGLGLTFDLTFRYYNAELHVYTQRRQKIMKILKKIPHTAVFVPIIAVIVQF
jgi:hypothetical protein